MNLREYIGSAVYTEAELDAYLGTETASWARFDPELGYVLGDCVVPDGIGGCNTFSSFEPTGERRLGNYRDRPCRIATYGDSMTQCHQVSDGETWQEYLAAHFGEPIRNFGVGGYGVYQALRRLRTCEARLPDTELVLFNLYSDDHTRSIDSWRWLRLGSWREVTRSKTTNSLIMVHGNPWPYVRLDLGSGAFVEFDNPFPTTESLYELCDPELAYEHFASDLVVRLLLARDHGTLDGRRELDELADALELTTDWSDEAAIRATAARMQLEYGQRASVAVLDWLRRDVAAAGKRLLLMLSYEDVEIARACDDRGWLPDRRFRERIAAFEIPTIDLLEHHRRDHADFALDGAAYAARHFDGHYLPAGNHFVAFASAKQVAQALGTPPPAYANRGASLQDVAAQLA